MDLLAHLEAYVAAVDEASFSRAADRLGIAQPLLSRRIKTLEAHFGGPLFDRSRRQVTTTEFGVLLLPYAQDVLDRARRLGQVARSARQSAARAVGVPSDCGPQALARVIRTGAERGVTLGVRELPPDERVLGLADGSLAYAVLRVPPEHAELRVPLGLARAPRAHHETPAARPRPVHLEDLRPRRERAPRSAAPVSSPVPAPAAVATAMTVIVMAEDQVPYFEDRLSRAAARAGLPDGLVRPAGPTATALAETLAGRVTLLCTEPFARRHGAHWTPLADASLHRGYDMGATRRRREVGDVPDWLTALLASAAGAAPTPRYAVRPEPPAEDPLARLAARG
ncbi:LysR family transcriptional regulator [Streptomyces sp. NPDC006739]|uniref:LysR family transcriptional regulator n=1 Tax=Streptomyces sp. NPDC006739 TaxID=3364763 RepID=UPI003688673C